MCTYMYIDPFAISGCCKSQQEKKFGKIFRRYFGGLPSSACHGIVVQLAEKIAKESQRSDFIAFLPKYTHVQ